MQTFTGSFNVIQEDFLTDGTRQLLVDSVVDKGHDLGGLSAGNDASWHEQITWAQIDVRQAFLPHFILIVLYCFKLFIFS
jgi:hypothetical protein